MSKQPKLILLNGFAGNGKTTIGKKYINENSLALLIEGDEIIVNIGQWSNYEPKAREIIFELTKSLVNTHLYLGHDVILPYLVKDVAHVNEFKKIADINGARFYNILLHNERSIAIANLLKRGKWGESDLEPLGKEDMPKIEALYDDMESQLELQKDAVIIDLEGHTAEETFDALKAILN